MAKLRKSILAYVAAAEREGARLIQLIHGGKHLKMVFERAGERRTLSCPCSPSDARTGALNFRQDLRRAFNAQRAARDQS